MSQRLVEPPSFGIELVDVQLDPHVQRVGLGTASSSARQLGAIPSVGPLADAGQRSVPRSAPGCSSLFRPSFGGIGT